MKSEPAWNRIVEFCEECSERTSHEVAIEFRAESTRPEHSGCSKHPYRVAICLDCDTETALRVDG